MFKKLFVGLVCGGVLAFNAFGQSVSGFENIISTVDSSYNGSNADQGHLSGSAHFWSSYNPAWFSWSGFAFSSHTDSVTPGWSNQYSCISGSGAHNSLAYAVAYSYAPITFNHSAQGDSIYGVAVNNSTYTYKSMLNGDAFAKKFGGASGNDSDWYYIQFVGLNDVGSTGTVRHYLADFRDSDNSKDYIQKDWQWVDLTSLGKIKGLIITFGSSDVDTVWGFINTPTYACIDSLVYKNSSNTFRPLARDDSYKTIEMISNEYPVLSNDKDPDAPLLARHLSVVQDFSQGTITVNSAGALVFNASTNAYGIDSLIYAIQDDDGLSDTAQFNLLINGAPEAVNDLEVVRMTDTTILSVKNNDVDEAIQMAKIMLLDSAKHGYTVVLGDTAIQYHFADLGAAPYDTVRYVLIDEYEERDTAMAVFELMPESAEERLSETYEINVYPNPANDLVNIELVNGGSGSYKLINSHGAVVNFGNFQDRVGLNVSNVPSGVYFVELSDGISIRRNKLIVR